MLAVAETFDGGHGGNGGACAHDFHHNFSAEGGSVGMLQVSFRRDVSGFQVGAGARSGLLQRPYSMANTAYTVASSRMVCGRNSSLGTAILDATDAEFVFNIPCEVRAKKTRVLGVSLLA